MLTLEQKEELDKEIALYQKLLREGATALGDIEKELNETKNLLTIETKTKEDIIIKNNNLQELYNNETKTLKEQISHLNKDVANYVKSLEQKKEEL